MADHHGRELATMEGASQHGGDARMKAAICRRYGAPQDVIGIEDVEKPVPKDDEVLIRVRAASMNPADGMMRGKPYFVRMISGLRKPKDTRVGHDVAGQVESVGSGVTRFKAGDEVFGVCRGAIAECACAHESKVVTKPAQVTFEQAAAAPVAALTALQGLRDKGKIQAGHKVLINGAAGGVGTFAVQMAKTFGAEVTGVCSMWNAEMVRSIGADHVIDYTREDFTKGSQRYDIFFDLVGDRSFRTCGRLLSPTGICIAAGVLGLGEGRWLGPAARILEAAAITRVVSRRFVTFIAKINTEDLRIIAELMASGKVKPVIDKCYGLSDAREALEYLGRKHARGKVVVSVA
jgi:NADPH:quinone reductase-like Zn-dependent oxidoreductase